MPTYSAWWIFILLNQKINNFENFGLIFKKNGIYSVEPIRHMSYFFFIIVFFIHYPITINIRNHETLNLNTEAKHATTHIRQDRNSQKLDLSKN